ncbi:hypothetical protein CDAR_409941 [Caerostris darwini]|uniref:Uncharacterized protein n=1 Tax=Caerostris darwini TaxID=1538125 RepID=A0AAV4VXD7_9ARAC|nr:hypothetical protein CDAR_409941 [Caerostris darwini]
MSNIEVDDLSLILDLGTARRLAFLTTSRFRKLVAWWTVIYPTSYWMYRHLLVLIQYVKVTKLSNETNFSEDFQKLVLIIEVYYRNCCFVTEHFKFFANDLADLVSCAVIFCLDMKKEFWDRYKQMSILGNEIVTSFKKCRYLYEEYQKLRFKIVSELEFLSKDQ